MSESGWASIFSSTVIGLGVVYVAWRQWQTDRERLIHDRFDRRFAVYKATDDFIRKAHTHGVSQEDILEFRTVTTEAYFLFDEALGSYLEHEILAKGQEIWSMTGKDVDPVEDTRIRRQLKDWMSDQRVHTRKKFATFLRSADGSWLSALRCFCRPDRAGGS
jgi:DNA-binding ferritin-like protein (Dps family)